MPRPTVRLAAPLLLALASLAGCSGPTGGSPTPPPPSGPGAGPTHRSQPPAVPASDAAARAAPTPPSDAAQAASWPGIHVDRERRQIDLDGYVVLREGEWLELIACSPGTREHEAILAITARPSHIHLALLSLGLTPGHPIQSREEGDGFAIVPPRGPAIDLFFVVDRDGTPREVPVHEWVIDQQNDRPMPPTPFLFTGSAFVEHEGQTLYMADLGGSVVSLVNFGDDLITRSSIQTNQTDNAQWGTRTDAIPPLNTAVTLRLRPAE